MLPLDQLCTIVTDVVRVEGPVHRDLIVQRVQSAWNLSRVGSNAIYMIQRALDHCWRTGQIRILGDFVWSVDSSRAQVRFPTSADGPSFRRIEHVCSEELAEAMILVVKHAVGVGLDDLLRETARVFGFRRVNDAIKSRLLGVHQQLLQQGRLTERDGVVSLPAQ